LRYWIFFIFDTAIVNSVRGTISHIIRISIVSVINAPTLSLLARPSRNYSIQKLYRRVAAVARSSHHCRRVCVCVCVCACHYTHDCTPTIRLRLCARGNSRTRVGRYTVIALTHHCHFYHVPTWINRKLPSAYAGWYPLDLGPQRASSSPPLHHPAPTTRSSLICGTKLSPLASPKKPILLFSRNSWAHAIHRKGLVRTAAGSNRVPFVPYGGLATNDSCYSFATQFSLHSTVPPARVTPPLVHILCLVVLYSSGMFGSVSDDFHQTTINFYTNLVYLISKQIFQIQYTIRSKNSFNFRLFNFVYFKNAIKEVTFTSENFNLVCPAFLFSNQTTFFENYTFA